MHNVRGGFGLGLAFFLGMKTGAAAHKGGDAVSQIAGASDLPVAAVSPPEALADLKSKGVQLVAVETVRGAAPFHHFDYRFPVAVVFGNEALGVSEAALKMCDAAVEIPVFGYKNSVNVATAVGIVSVET